MATRILSIIGRKRSGKTTLTVALASEFVRKGRRVMTIKQDTQPSEFDRPGSDSHLHLHEGKAERVLLASPQGRLLLERTSDQLGPEELARQYLAGADIVLVEGFPDAALPKIEVYRRETGPGPLYREGSPNANDWVAIVTDDDKLQAECPVLRFRDTMWLQLVANLAWEKSKVLE